MLQCGVGMRGMHSFVVGLLLPTRVMGGVVALGEDMIKGFREVKEVRGSSCYRLLSILLTSLNSLISLNPHTL